MDIFRPAADAVEIVRQAVAIRAPAVWLQSGIVSAEARRIAIEAGMDYVEDRCLVGLERARGGLSRSVLSPAAGAAARPARRRPPRARSVPAGLPPRRPAVAGAPPHRNAPSLFPDRYRAGGTRRTP